MDKLKNFVKAITTINTGQRQDVLIFSTPRSGSTWLLEIIVANCSGKSIGEPFDLRKSQVSKYLNTSDWNFLIEPKNHSFLTAYLKKLSKGKLSFKNPPPFTKFYKPIVDHSVIKILHGGETFSRELIEGMNAKSIFLIRHPVPVSLSRKQLPRLGSFLDSEDFNLHTSQRKKLNEIVSRNNSFELGIIDWCYQNQLGIQSEGVFDLKVSYEDLLIEPEVVLDRLSKISILNESDDIEQSLSLPSRNSFKSNSERIQLLNSKERDETKLLKSWMQKVNESHLVSAQNILDIFEIDFYKANSPYPKYQNSY